MRISAIPFSLCLVLAFGACTNQADHVESATSLPAPATTAQPQLDRLWLPDGTSVALGDQVDNTRFTALQGGQYQIKAAFGATVLAPQRVIVAIVSPDRHGGTIPGFTYGAILPNPPGWISNTFGGLPAFSHSIPGGAFYAVWTGCATGPNLALIVADGYKAALEAEVVVSSCDPSKD